MHEGLGRDLGASQRALAPDHLSDDPPPQPRATFARGAERVAIMAERGRIISSGEAIVARPMGLGKRGRDGLRLVPRHAPLATARQPQPQFMSIVVDNLAQESGTARGALDRLEHDHIFGPRPRTRPAPTTSANETPSEILRQKLMCHDRRDASRGHGDLTRGRQRGNVDIDMLAAVALGESHQKIV